MTKLTLKKALSGLMSAAMLVSSVPFAGASSVSAAGSSNYAEALELSLYFYDANQCGSEVDDNCLTWRGNCHTYDSTASLDSAQGLSSASKEAIKSANGGSSTVDVSGGYHDAGDHIKFTKTMGFSMTSLAWSYFSHPNAYKSTGTEGHLKYILRNNADYFMKVTYLNGNDVIAYCYQVASEGEDHSIWTAPETQTMNRTTYWADSSHSDGCSAGWMSACLAATSIAFKDDDPTYAAECLKYANALQNFAKKYPNTTSDGYGNMYANWNNAHDEIAFAELWCTLAGNGGKLPSSYNPTYKLIMQGKYTGDHADYNLYTWDKAWSGYAALLLECGYDTNTYLGEVQFEYNNMGGLSTSSYSTPGYDEWGFSRYNCALQMMATHIADATNNDSYYEACKYQMDYILGNNPTGYSFLIGYGDKYALRYHHRAANPGTGNPADNTEAKYVLYGALIGGCNKNGEYLDHQNEYKYTEPALDYNGCFALAISALVDKYGGDTTAAKTVIKNASEINENFDFGGSTVQPEITGKAEISVVDAETNELLPGVEMYVWGTPASPITSVPTIVLDQYKWNTSSENPKILENLSAFYDKELNMYTSYAISVLSVPEGYKSYEERIPFDFLTDTSVNIVIPIEKIEETTTTTTTTTTSTTTTTTTTAIPPDGVLYGDANDNGDVEVADAVFILQSLADPSNSEFKRTPQGEINADCHNPGNGVDSEDALAILKWKSSLIDSLPFYTYTN